MERRRRSGIILHPTSLPGREGIGTLGEEARRFVAFLAAAGQSLWQVLPLGPPGYGNSPYSCYSAFAGNPLLVDLGRLAAEGDLPASLVPEFPEDDRIDYERVTAAKVPLLRQAAAAFFVGGDRERLEEFWRFCDGHNWWLHDFALFMAARDYFGGKSWCDWPADLVSREPTALARYSELLGPAIGEVKYAQWQFFRQWRALKTEANAAGIDIFGDIPIFVAYDSADVWANPRLFRLDEAGRPTVVAGVPPDYFSKTGQRWGNPLYDWDACAADGYGWWIGRMRTALELYDLVRIDHFRGFEAYWEVPAAEKTAVGGRWVKGPGETLFRAMAEALGSLPIVAEDLGVITPEVEELRDRFGLPGMKILQFAFGSGPSNPYLPHNHVRNCVVYTGTHDNDTTLGWFTTLPAKERSAMLAYLGAEAVEMPWPLIRAALASVADLAVLPLQDILELPASARMNVPGTAHGNWGWRAPAEGCTPGLAKRIREFSERYGRHP